MHKLKDIASTSLTSITEIIAKQTVTFVLMLIINNQRGLYKDSLQEA